MLGLSLVRIFALWMRRPVSDHDHAGPFPNRDRGKAAGKLRPRCVPSLRSKSDQLIL
jgi:hypothetical protein